MRWWARIGEDESCPDRKTLTHGMKTPFIAIVPAESCANVTALSLGFHSNAVYSNSGKDALLFRWGGKPVGDGCLQSRYFREAFTACAAVACQLKQVFRLGNSVTPGRRTACVCSLVYLGGSHICRLGLSLSLCVS